MPVSSDSSVIVRGARTNRPSMSITLVRFVPVLRFMGYPHFTRHPRDLPRASPHLPLMRRIGSASAGCALWQVSAKAAGYVGGEGHRKAPIQRAASRTAPVNPSATSAMIASPARSESPVRSPWRIILRFMASASQSQPQRGRWRGGWRRSHRQRMARILATPK